MIIHEYEKDLLAKSGLRMGDYLEIRPIEGKRKKLKLLRTKILFYSDEVENRERYYHKVKLPSIKGRRFKYLLELVSHGQPQEEKGIFRLRSLCGNPFRVNGSFSFDSYLERGDKVAIDFNRLLFQDSSQISAIGESLSDKLIVRNHHIFKSNLNILLEGETGTGKTHLAKVIHHMSGRQGPFIHINLASFAPSLIESEIFGHTRGAFTGATKERIGALREARSGTLFMDEIDSLPREIQTKLLLFLDSKEVRPVGGSQFYQVDTRLIFASGQKVELLLKNGEMRKDFYYRLCSGAHLRLSPLREERSRIRGLCNEFCQRENVVMSHELMGLYQSFPWPGNIRQLLSHLSKKKVFASGRKLVFDFLDEELLACSPVDNLEQVEEILPLTEYKKNYILKMYYYCHQNINNCARVLKIAPSTVRTTIRQKKVA